MAMSLIFFVPDQAGIQFQNFSLIYLVNFKAPGRAGMVLLYLYHVGGPGLNLQQQTEAVNFKLLVC